MSHFRIVLLGPPASGKGTQGRLIAKKWSLPMTSSGEILRRECSLGTPVGLEADRYINLGKLVPDNLIIESVKSWLDSEVPQDHLLQNSGFIFDGTPRTLVQATKIQDILLERNTPLTAVFFLEVPYEQIADRVKHRIVCSRCSRSYRIGWEIPNKETSCPKCGGSLEKRKDDDPEALLARIEEYKTKTEPLVAYYESLKVLKRINAKLSPQDTFEQISEILLKTIEVENQLSKDLVNTDLGTTDSISANSNSTEKSLSHKPSFPTTKEGVNL